MQNQPIVNDQVTALKKQIPLILLINLPLVLSLAWIYWPLVQHTSLLIWSGLMLLVMLVRLVAFIYVSRKNPVALDNPRQQKILVLNSALSGLLWAWAGYLFFVPESLEYQLIILMVLILKGTGSVSSIVNDIKAFYAYFPVSMLPVTLLFFLQANTTSILLGTISFSFVMVMLFFARNLNRTLIESLRIRYENQHLLEETERRKQEAETANLAKTQFLAAASHDLRQPIHAMSLLINILEARTAHSAPDEIVTRLRATSDALKNLLDSLLDISRLDAGAVEAHRQVVCLDTIFETLANEFQVLAEEKNLRLNFNKQGFYVNTDPLLLEQVLRNLLANGIRYTSSGSITVDASLNQTEVIIAVTDTGIGIGSQQQQAIFDEFYQVGNQERDRQHGLGLGLSIVRRTLSLLGSEIKVASDLGKGSRFSFSLPVVKGQANKSAPLVTPALSGAGDNDVIAIIEDDKQAGEALQLLLESWGYRAYVATNSDALIESFSSLSITPKALISDFQLSEHRSGVQEIQKMRSYYGESLPALLITGHINAERMDEVQQSNLSLLYKPVAPAKLRTFLRSSLA